MLCPKLPVGVMDPSLIYSQKSFGIHRKKNDKIFSLYILSQVRFKSGAMSFGTHCADTSNIVDDCMDAVLGDTHLSGNVMLPYSYVCHDDVMNVLAMVSCVVNVTGLHKRRSSSRLPVTFEFSSLLLHSRSDM